jgi:Flp pilus assembly protein TadG
MRSESNQCLLSDPLLASASSERGQDLVEFALILPLLLVLTLGIIDLGRVVFSYNTIANAAREGARWGIVSHGTLAADVAKLNDTTTSPVVALVSGLACSGGPKIIATKDLTSKIVLVKVGCDVKLITGALVEPFAGTNHFFVYAEATMRVE